MVAAVGFLNPIELQSADKLAVLRRLDRYREWRSLDEKRYCLVCGKVVQGHDIQVIGGTRGTGALRLICVTPGCHSIPMDWVLPTDEVLAKMSMLENQKRFDQPPKSTKIPREKFAARVRKLTTHFRRAA
jgi:hypothetical protein